MASDVTAAARLVINTTAHQRIIREREANGDSESRLFYDDWQSANLDISNGVVKECSRALAKEIILKYEWLGSMPAVVWHTFGIFYDGICAGVVCYSPEYSENLGKQAREQGRKCADWSKYGFEGKMILLSRGACVHWAHPHSASKLIRQSMKMLPEKYEVVTATVDPAAGEIGTIYQACGFYYVGSMREGNANVKARPLDRDGWLIEGRIWSSRSIRARVGSTRREDILRMFPEAQFVKQHSKGRYFAFRGSKKVKAQHRTAIAHLLQPYPKRIEE